MKISIVTVVFNARHTIEQSITSVLTQKNCDVEHVIVDGGSTDGTLELIRSQATDRQMVLSEPDSGIYDALNKGFGMATGEVVGILHADDCFKDEFVLSRVRTVFSSNNPDYVYGDIEMVDANERVVRYWRAGALGDGKIKSSQIPHPALFLRHDLIKKLGVPFDTSYKISGDLKQQLIIANKIGAKGMYLESPLVRMRIGGTSTKNFAAYLAGWRESRRAWNEVEGKGGTAFVVKKVASKLKGLRKSLN